MKATRKPWKVISLEDVGVTRLRQHIREAQYWEDRAKGDTARHEICKARKLAFMVALGEAQRYHQWTPSGVEPELKAIPFFADMVNPDGEAAHGLWLAGQYLAYVEREGRDAEIKASDPFDPAAAFEPMKTYNP